MQIYGINQVLEALKAGRVVRVWLTTGSDKRIDEIMYQANGQRVPIERVDQSALDRAAKGGVHQGVVAEIEDAREYSLPELVAGIEGASHQLQRPLLVVLDGIEDPHNVGA